MRFVLFLVMGLIPYYGYAAGDHSTLSGPAIGTTAPDFEGRNVLTGEKVPLGSARGKIVIVTFWASWCGPCRRELPILEAAQKLVGQNRLTIFAVSYRESSDAIRAIKKMAVNWHINFVEDYRGTIAEHYGISAIPHLFMIDRMGKVLANHLGYGDSSVQALVNDLNRALAVTPDEPNEPTQAAGN
jgi:thiol-disulfide isomerase/thioredoxin